MKPGQSSRGRKIVLTQKRVLETIAKHKSMLQERYGVKTIGLFGSFARNEEIDSSDVDLLVEFERPIGINFVILAEEIEGILNRKVDLVSKRGVKRPYLAEIEKDIIYV